MRHPMLAITLVVLIAYSTTIIGCKSSGAPTASGPSDVLHTAAALDRAPLIIDNS